MKVFVILSIIVACVAATPGYLGYSHAVPHHAAVHAVPYVQVAAVHAAPAVSYSYINHHPHSYGPVAYGVYGAHYAHGLAPGQDTHEVAVAKANHLAAHAHEAARHAYAGHYAHGLAPGQDTHEVAVAKANHLAAHAQEKARHLYAASHVAPLAYAGAYAGHYAHGLAPGQDTHEVAIAKANHFAAHAEEKARHAHIAASSAHYAPYGYASPYGYAGHYTYLAPGQDTPEVAIAKANHLAAHAEEKARHAHVAASNAHYGSYLGYASPYGYGHYAVLAPGQDTHEVAVAKAHHFAAHAEANARLAHAHHY